MSLETRSAPFSPNPNDQGSFSLWITSCCFDWLLGVLLLTAYVMDVNLISQTHSVQFSSVAQSCPTLCDPMNCSMPGLLVHHQLLEFTQTRFHRVSDAIQPSHPLSSPSLPAPNPSQHQSLFQWVNSSHEVANFFTVLFHLHQEAF